MKTSPDRVAVPTERHCRTPAPCQGTYLAQARPPSWCMRSGKLESKRQGCWHWERGEQRAVPVQGQTLSKGTDKVGKITVGVRTPQGSPTANPARRRAIDCLPLRSGAGHGRRCQPPPSHGPRGRRMGRREGTGWQMAWARSLLQGTGWGPSKLLSAARLGKTRSA